MTKLVSLEIIENAFNEMVRSIDEVENIISAQVDIEINEMKIAQLEKVEYLKERLENCEGLKLGKYHPIYKLA
jgi:hypothetical protein